MDLNGDGNFTVISGGSLTGELDDTVTSDAANKWTARDIDSAASTPPPVTDLSLSHDGNGSMTDDGQSYKYVWDAFGRLVTVKNQSNAVVATYGYNGYGYLIKSQTDVTQNGGGGPNGTVDSYDPTYFSCYDDLWRPVAVYRGSDDNSHVKVRTVYHNAGANGLGGSSYIDSAVLRDRDADTNWYSAADTTPEERICFCQNWRGDVVADTDSSGQLIEWIMYSAYGVPSSYALAEFNFSGTMNSTDETNFWSAIGGTGPGKTDLDFDGNAGGDGDFDAFYASYNDTSNGGVGVLSRAKTDNRAGYASYPWEPAVGMWYCQRRFLNPGLGRWLSRDPAGYANGPNIYGYVRSQPLTRRDPMGLWDNGQCQRDTDPRDPGQPMELNCANLCVSNPGDSGVTACLPGDFFPRVCCICTVNIDRHFPGASWYFKDIVAECTAAHENERMGLKCYDGNNPTPQSYCADCLAYTAQLECLYEKRDHNGCKGDVECNKQLRDWISDREALRDFVCAHCGGADPLPPPKKINNPITVD